MVSGAATNGTEWTRCSSYQGRNVESGSLYALSTLLAPYPFRYLWWFLPFPLVITVHRGYRCCGGESLFVAPYS